MRRTRIKALRGNSVCVPKAVRLVFPVALPAQTALRRRLGVRCGKRVRTGLVVRGFGPLLFCHAGHNLPPYMG
jgi:hypothetical protein